MQINMAWARGNAVSLKTLSITLHLIDIKCTGIKTIMVVMLKNMGCDAMKIAAFNLMVAMSVGLSPCAWAEDLDLGQVEYQSNCAACHGVGAKGDGPVSKELKVRPTDLTMLAKKNNGVFPFNAVYRTIDGRDPIASHGTREMPVWGYRFVPSKHFDLKLSDDYIYAPPLSPEAAVRARILAVIDYLDRIQEK